MYNFNKSSRNQWIIFCATGEFIGIAIAAILTVVHFKLAGEPVTLTEKLLALSVMIVAGVMEGALVAWFQWRVLQKYFPSLSLLSWEKVTIAAATTGWFIGTIPSLFFFSSTTSTAIPANEPPFGLILLLAAVSGIVLGAMFGGFQWMELRKHVSTANQWIWANACGWGIGIIWVYIAASLPDAQTPVWITVLLGAVSGMLMGLSVGIVTSIWLRKIINSSTIDISKKKGV